MNFQEMYRQKLTTPEEAVKVIRSGDWVDYGWSTGTPDVLDKALAARAEELGQETEYIHCSGDPDSLDAVVLPGLGVAVADGTAPHGTAPLGHHAKKVRICKALRGRNYDGSSTRHGSNRTLLQDKLFEVRRNCSIKKPTRYRL